MQAELYRSVLIGLRNILLGANLASLRLVTQPKRLVAYATSNLIYYQKVTGTRGLVAKNVFTALGTCSTQEVKLGGLSGTTWFYYDASYLADIISLCMICQITRPRLIFEIGTFTGYSTLHMALNSPIDARVFTLDLPDDRPVDPALGTTSVDVQHIQNRSKARPVFEGTDVADKITRVYGDSATFDFTQFHDTIDLFFIDGAHSYEYVRSDTTNALKCCHSGSVIAWHDYGRMGVNGVSKWLHELASKGHTIYCIPGGSLAFMLV